MINRISDHISYTEGVRSATAARLNIDNNPTPEIIENMRAVAREIFEPLRDWVTGPIRVNSFYRSSALNKAIGGAKRSQHTLGQAIDLDDSYGFKTNAEMFAFIKDNLNFDKLIWEYGTEDNPDWVHVSYVSEEDNRGLCYQAVRRRGKTRYIGI